MIDTHSTVHHHPLYSPPCSNPSIREAIDAFKIHQLEALAYDINHEHVSSLDEFRDTVNDWQDCGSWAADLTLDDCFELLETHGDTYGLRLDVSTFDGLQGRIESLASSLVCTLGAQEALEVVDDLGELLDGLGLDVDSVQATNSYEMFRHYGERTEDGWKVYEHRNVEGSHVDIYEHPDCGLYVLESLDEKDLTEEEKTWDAS